jgi:hypothetical protein
VRLHGCRASLSGDTAFERFSCGGAGQHSLKQGSGDTDA